MLYRISSTSLSEAKASWPEFENAVEITLSFIGFEFVTSVCHSFILKNPIIFLKGALWTFQVKSKSCVYIQSDKHAEGVPVLIKPQQREFFQ